MKDLVIVSDPGIDDAVALGLIEKILPDIPKLLISTFGNAPEPVIRKNAQDIVNFLGKNWSFQSGPEMPLNGKVEHPWPDYFHGKDGLWGVETPAGGSELADHTFSYRHVLSLGPLTAIPDILANHSVEQLTIMGGAFDVSGNETPYAETNMAFDADAAKLVFDNIGHTTVYVVPLDATRRAYWSLEKVKAIVEDSELSHWLKQLIIAWNQNYDHSKEKDFNLHDPLAAYLAVHPDKVDWRKKGVSVVAQGEQRGRTVFEASQAMSYIAPASETISLLAEEIFGILFTSKDGLGKS